MTIGSFERKVLIKSMLCAVFNRIKMCIAYPQKNIEIAENPDVRNLIYLLGEQILPQWCHRNQENGQAINEMHNIIYLFSQKVHQVFQARVIHQIIDQNWDLKGFRAVIMRIFEKIQIKDTISIKNFDAYIEKQINSQNLQSTSCIKAIGSFLRKNKAINEDDLSNPIKTYQTTYPFLKYDIERYREQKIGYECFQVLHPWAYDLDSVDMKYIVNTNLAEMIGQYYQNDENTLQFWMSFFKSQMACSSDEFMEALRQLSEMNGISGFYAGRQKEIMQMMAECNYVITVEQHSELISTQVNALIEESQRLEGHNALACQYKLYEGNFTGSQYADHQMLSSMYTLNDEPSDTIGEYVKDLELTHVKQLNGKVDLCRKNIHVKSDQVPDKTLVLCFDQADTEELKGLNVRFNGDRALFKLGEGETSHYHIPNDKKLWETQFMILCIDGKYYIRDMDFVHTTRLKLDNQCEVQIQKGSVVDLGKVVHYHFDKLVHIKEPTKESNQGLYILRTGNDYDIGEEDDIPELRARPTWVSAEESHENIQNEINVIVDDIDGKKNVSSVGRSMKRDIQIKLKAVSAEHCAISYFPEKGWTITEKGKNKPSSNGTYIFLKSLKQMQEHMPSDLIQLQEGMTLSFVNYELKIKFEQKQPGQVQQQIIEQQNFFQAQEDANIKVCQEYDQFSASISPAGGQTQYAPEEPAQLPPPVIDEEQVMHVQAPIEEPAQQLEAAAPVEELVAAPEEIAQVQEAVQEPIYEEKADVDVPVEEPAHEVVNDAPQQQDPVIQESMPAEEVLEDNFEQPVDDGAQAHQDVPEIDEAQMQEPEQQAESLKQPSQPSLQAAAPEEQQVEAPAEEIVDQAPVDEVKADEAPAQEPASNVVEEAPKEEIAAAEEVQQPAAAVEEPAAAVEEPAAAVEEKQQEAPAVEVQQEEPQPQPVEQAPVEEAKPVEEAPKEEVQPAQEAPKEDPPAEVKQEEPAAVEQEPAAAVQEQPPAEEPKEEVQAVEEQQPPAQESPAKEEPVQEAPAAVEEPPREEEKPAEANVEEPREQTPPKQQEAPSVQEEKQAEPAPVEEKQEEQPAAAEAQKEATPPKEVEQPAAEEKKEEAPAQEAPKEASAPKEKEATPPKAKEATPPNAKEATPPNAKEATPPQAKEATPPKAQEATPPKAQEAPAAEEKKEEVPAQAEAAPAEAKKEDPPAAEEKKAD